MADLWVRVPHEEDKRKCVVVRVELLPEGGYSVRDGRIEETSATNLSVKKPKDTFTADDFSQKLAEFGFEENEVRMQIEETISGLNTEDPL